LRPIIIALSKAAIEREFLIVNSQWQSVPKTKSIINSEASGQTDGKIKLEVLTKHSPRRSAKEITKALRQNQLEKDQINMKIIKIKKRHNQSLISACE
jgi:hypothetical protein